MRISNPLGVKGERIAAEYLQNKGYRIIERNFRKQYGEVDIITVHNNTLIFIEVKTRSSDTFGGGLEAISSWKLKSLMKTGRLYKKLHWNLPESLRIDAISVEMEKSGEVKKIEHIENITM